VFNLVDEPREASGQDSFCPEKLKALVIRADDDCGSIDDVAPMVKGVFDC
jgi:hypothetical protein